MRSEEERGLLADSDPIIVKVGSRVLSGTQNKLDIGQVNRLGQQLSRMMEAGKRVVLVSSGAVAAGMGRLGLESRPRSLARLQAVASVGQAHLIQAYEAALAENRRHAAQVLLTADDLDDRKRYLNLRNTLVALLEMGVVPIVNENDSVSVDELLTTFGDNDRLAAMVAGLFQRPALVILSDVEGVFDTRTESTHDANILHTIDRVDEEVLALAVDKKTGLSKGGMASKLKAAQFVTRSGAPVVIAGGRVEGVLQKVLAGETIGTLFKAEDRALSPRKRWIGFSAQTVGSITCDWGATEALQAQTPSLLAIGITAVRGPFEKGDIVAIRNPDETEFARGLINYSHSELEKIRGLQSDSIESVLGHCPYEEVIHRDNIALL
ncbi:MAG: glutamate 5-kinase [Pirellulaceae bacterium]